MTETGRPAPWTRPRRPRGWARRATGASIALVALLIGPPAGLFGSTAGPSTVHGVAGVAPATVAPAALGFNLWPEFHRSPLLSGAAPSSNLSTSNVHLLGMRWATDLYSAALDSPVVAYDSFRHRTLAFVGNEAGDLLAVNLSDGQIAWGRWLGSPIRSTPLVSDGSVYAATLENPAIVRLNMSDGSIQCTAVAPMPVESTPTIAVPPGGVRTLYIGTNDAVGVSGPVLAINANNCSVEWAFTAYAQISGSWDAVSYVVNASGTPLVVFGTADPDASVYAVNAVTGKLVWRFQTYNPSPGVYDVGAGATLTPPGTPGFPDGAVFVPTKFGILYALNLTGGRSLYKTNFNRIANATEGGRSTPALYGGQVVFGYNGGVFDLNESTGAVAWLFKDPTHTEVLSSPAIAGPVTRAVVVAADLAGDLDVLALSTGRSLDVLPLGGYITASPAVVGGDILVASSNGFLYDLAVGGGSPSAPASTVTAYPVTGSTLPNPGGFVNLSGSAYSPAGVRSVEVAVESGGTGGPWFNPGAARWDPGPIDGRAHLSAPGANVTNWTFSLPVPSAGGTFTAVVYTDGRSGVPDVHPAVTGFVVGFRTNGPFAYSNSSFVAPGTSTSVVGGGFLANETVGFWIGSHLVATAGANASGGFASTRVPVPPNTAFGPTSLLVVGNRSGRSASVDLTVANSWDESGAGPARLDYEPNDPVLNLHVFVGGRTWLYPAWHFVSAHPLTSSPVVDDGVAYLADSAGAVTALRMSNGGFLWNFTLPSKAVVGSSPAVDPSAGKLIEAASDGTVDALATSSGALLWNTSVGPQLGAPTVGLGRVYLRTSAGTLAALSESDGARLWTHPLVGGGNMSPALDLAAGRLVVAESNGTVVALNASTGNVQWSFRASGNLSGSPTVYRGTVLFGTLSGKVYALREGNGSVNWTTTVNGAVNSTGAVVARALGGGFDYVVGTALGEVVLLQISSGMATLSYNFTSPVSGLSGVEGIVVTNLASGVTYADRSYANLKVWTLTGGPTAFPGTPVIVDGTVMVVARGGGLYAFTTFGQPPV